MRYSVNLLPDALCERIFDCMPVARLAVLGTNDTPDVMPIVFARVGAKLYSPIDGKPKKHARLARLDAIRANPQVGLVLDYYSADWQSLWWIKLSCRAAVVDETLPDFGAVKQALQQKYPQYREVDLFHGPPTAIEFSIAEQRWWASRGVAGVESWLAAAQ